MSNKKKNPACKRFRNLSYIKKETNYLYEKNKQKHYLQSTKLKEPMIRNKKKIAQMTVEPNQL